jgi:hypothetical protein
MRISTPRKMPTRPNVFHAPVEDLDAAILGQEKTGSFWSSRAWSCGRVDVRLVAQEAAESARRY